MRHRAILIIFTIFIGIIGTMFSLAQEDCPPSQTEITVYTSNDLLTIHIPQAVSLKGVNFNTIFEGQPARFYLDAYPEFALLNLDYLDAPRCLHIQVEGTNPIRPQACNGLIPSQEVIQSIPADQNFWYDMGANRKNSLTINQFAYPLGSCPNTDLSCAMNVPPLTESIPFNSPCMNPILCELFLGASQIEGAEKFEFKDNGGELNTSLTPECAFWGDYGVQINFNMPLGQNGQQGGYGGWGVHWEFSNTSSYDISNQTFLTFWLKAERPMNFQIGIKDVNDVEAKVDLDNWVQTTGWSFFSVPMSRFANDGVNLTQIENISLGFNEDHGQGTVCLDNIAFVQEAIIQSNTTINARSNPNTACDVLNTLNTGQSVYVVAENILGTPVNNDPNWALILHNNQYLYVHHSFVITSTLISSITETPTPIVDGLLLIDNFEEADRVNALGGEMGAFYPQDDGNSVVEAYVTLPTPKGGGF